MTNKHLESSKAKQVLAARAKLIAKKKMDVSSTSDAAILVFYVGAEQKYAIPYTAIDKVVSAQKTIVIPGVNPLCSGLLYHNAEIWPVVNLDVLLNCKETETVSNFILLQDRQYHYAFRIGTIIGQVEYDESITLDHLSAGESEQQSSSILGIYQADIALLNIEAIFKLLGTIQIE
ncbi:chemotaxis protein CheW [Legionella jamestowniensis]|uniref:CheW-like domain protein n=1 Tax=Legionella jamestowniensis TaxID=455 RepID=A0A0W0UNG5_9GAMM|nr:chemotaxis protein CheW [Legionella jamestowniensis]KTD09424.1 CheW-like domain protein [Legionella jamestowniensis]OCH99250.1 hypothetical protein A8135_08375 [Legionella jamestowniensis]SFL89065.1 Chemotaxis signal transduction protein [Legionella jamestowniensis DSM 19215]